MFVLSWLLVVKLRLGALIPRSVCLSVCRSVGRSVCPPKITKNYKTLQNFTKHYKTLENDKIWIPHSLSCVKTVKEASALCRSFLDGVVIFIYFLGRCCCVPGVLGVMVDTTHPTRWSSPSQIIIPIIILVMQAMPDNKYLNTNIGRN